jgi:hypothetical protein
MMTARVRWLPVIALVAEFWGLGDLGRARVSSAWERRP